MSPAEPDGSDGTAPPEDRPAAVRGDDAPPERIRVLHVDDDRSFTELTAEFLERADDRFEVVTETAASAGLDRLADEPVDCVVSDYEMPGMDGLEFLRAVREADDDVPFILFTGRGSEAVASEAIAAGVTDYLQKETGTDQYEVLANRVSNAVEQHRSRRALAASQKRLSLFIDQSPLGVIEWNDEFEVVQLNEAAEEILGYDEAAVRGDSVERFVPEDVVAEVEEIADALLSDAGGYHSVNRNVRADGTEIVCEWHNRVVTDEDGAVVAVFSQFQEVTDRRERRAAIEDLHERTRDLVGAESREEVAEITVDAAANVLDMPINSVYAHDADAGALVPLADSEAARERLGPAPTFDEGEALAWDAFESGDVLLYDDVSEIRGRYNEETAVRSEIIVPLGEHGVVLVGATEVGAYDDTDVALARILASAAEEALSRLDREASLRRSRRRYRTLVENFPDGGVFLYDDDLRYLLAGGTEIEAVGLSAEEMVGATVHDLFPPEIVEEQEPHLRAALDGERRTFEQQFQGNHYRVWAVPLGDEDVDTAMLVSQNVTERRERRRELEQRNERLDAFASVVSHDLRNPMSVARGYLNLLQADHDDERIDEIGAALDRMERIVDDLLALTRTDDEGLAPVETDLSRLATAAWATVDTAAATLRADDAPRIRADPEHTKRLLENLFRNSVEHGSTGSRPEADDADDAPSTPENPTSPLAGDCAGLCVEVGPLADGEGFYVADDGAGIDPELRERVFESGYSTGDDGLGLGLSIVKRIAEAHGWTPSVTESADGGARFEFRDVETL